MNLMLAEELPLLDRRVGRGILRREAAKRAKEVTERPAIGGAVAQVIASIHAALVAAVATASS